MYEIKVYKSKWKAIKLILLTLPFVIIALYDILTHSMKLPRVLDWFFLCFFGLGIAIGLFNLFDRRPEIILNEKGIFDRISYGVFNKDPNRGFVEWKSISDAWIQTYQQRSPQGIPTSKQKYICIKLDDKAAAKIKKNKFSIMLGLGDYIIPLMNLKKFDEQKFLSLIKEMRNLDVHQKEDMLKSLNQ
jgi:hypothetical protein